jgi:iron complex outermembrane receptor protein
MRSSHFLKLNRLFLMIAATSALRAEDTNNAPEKLSPVVVKGSILGAGQGSNPAMTVLSGAALDGLSQQSIGDILADIPGVASTYFGPNSSRPIIRGLEGDRLKIIQNGTNTMDASSVSPDHAVSVDPMTVRELQILRGPEALRYGSSILGGVVNLVDNRIPVERLPRQTILSARAGSADGLRSSGILMENTLGDFAWHLDGFQKSTHDISTPVGVISDTASDHRGAGLGVSYIAAAHYLGLSYTGLNSTYGVAEPGVTIGLQQRRWELAGAVTRTASSFKSISYKASASDYTHTEYDTGLAGSTFTNQGWDSRLDFELTPGDFLEAEVGLQWGQFDFKVVGAEAFLPSTQNAAGAGFGSFLQKFTDPSLRLRYGFRVETAKIQADEWLHDGVTATYPADQRTFTPKSFSITLEKDLNPAWVSTLTLTRTERAPNYQELYADGPHLGTDAYEVGNRGLEKETGAGIAFGLAKVGGAETGSLSLYYNRFSSFIAQARNGFGPDLTAGSGADYREGGTEELARYDFISIPADFWGAEVKLNFKLQEGPTAKLNLEWFGDYVRASNRTTGEALPRISPGRLGVALNGLTCACNWRVDLAYHLAQNHLAPDETPTAGYTLLGATLSYPIKLSAVDTQFTLRLTNLLNREARNASSFIKDVLPLPGRSVEAGLKLTF